MKIAISGGMGFENRLIEVLKNFEIILIGGNYNLQKESFETIKNATFFPEFVTYNYLENFSGVDVFIDVSRSNKSKYLISDFKEFYCKKCYLIYYDEYWKIAVLSSKGMHFNLIKPYQKSLPFVVFPKIYIEGIIDFFSKETDNFLKKEDYLFDIENERRQNLSLKPVDDNKFEFLNGQIADIVSVSCSDNSVAISPMNDCTVDLKKLKGYISQFASISKETQFFIEFKIERYRVLVFRQGRVVVKGTKEKNTALYIYYSFVGD